VNAEIRRYNMERVKQGEGRDERRKGWNERKV